MLVFRQYAKPPASFIAKYPGNLEHEALMPASLTEIERAKEKVACERQRCHMTLCHADRRKLTAERNLWIYSSNKMAATGKKITLNNSYMADSILMQLEIWRTQESKSSKIVCPWAILKYWWPCCPSFTVPVSQFTEVYCLVAMTFINPDCDFNPNWMQEWKI